MKRSNTMFIILAVTLAFWSWSFAGFDAGKHHYASMGPNLILAVFWSVFLGVLVYERIIDVRINSDLKMLETLNKALEPIVEKIEHETDLTERIITIIKEVVRDNRPPDAAEEKIIKQRFFDETGHKVMLEVHADGKGMDVHITKKSVATAHKTSGTKIEVKDESQPQKIKVTKK